MLPRLADLPPPPGADIRVPTFAQFCSGDDPIYPAERPEIIEQ